MVRTTIRRRSVYLVTIVAMLAMVGGFAFATFGFTTQAAPQQGQEYVGISGVAQLSTPTITLAATPSGTVSSTTCTSGSPCSVGTSPVSICLTATCTAGTDDAEIVDFPVAAYTGTTYTFNIVVTVNGVSPVTTYYTEASGATASSLTLVWDAGAATGPTAVTSIDIVANSP